MTESAGLSKLAVLLHATSYDSQPRQTHRFEFEDEPFGRGSVLAPKNGYWVLDSCMIVRSFWIGLVSERLLVLQATQGRKVVICFHGG